MHAVNVEIHLELLTKLFYATKGKTELRKMFVMYSYSPNQLKFSPSNRREEQKKIMFMESATVMFWLDWVKSICDDE